MHPLSPVFLLAATLGISQAQAGGRRAETELLRPWPGSPKVFVQATLPDGSTGLFMVDTGADITVLEREVADRLGLELDSGAGTAQGITHSTVVDFGRLPWLKIGPTLVEEVDVVVGLPGPFGFISLDGIIGNNVWSRYTLEIDYRADVLFLHEVGSVRLPRRAAPMRYDQSHIHTPVVLRPEGSPGQPLAMMVALDTGANGLMLIGPQDLDPLPTWSEGVEPILGMAAAASLPQTAFLRTTRRLALQSVSLGGTTVPADFKARWLDWDAPNLLDPAGIDVQGLAGHELFEGRRAIFDFAGGRFALLPSHRRPEIHNAYERLLSQDIATWGDNPSRLVYRAQQLLGLHRQDEALDALERMLASNDPAAAALDGQARILAAELRRQRGDIEAAWRLLAPLSPAELVEGDAIVALINGLLLDARHDEAADVSEAALSARPGDPRGWLARSDLLVWTGDPDGAREALQEALRIVGRPEGEVLRRARVAVARSDHDGALSILRQAMLVNPLDGPALWFYTLLAVPADATTVRFDLQRALDQTHRDLRPFDFLSGAFEALGDHGQAMELMQQGMAMECQPLADVADHANCLAWYQAMAHEDLDLALRRVHEALAVRPHRASYLDTLAMVSLARGDLAAAHAAALQAARLQPEDPYMLWQVDRIRRLTDSSPSDPHGPATPLQEP